MKKSIALAAAGAIALTGCDFAGSTEAVPVPVASIEVSNLPAMNGDEAWDSDQSAPDIYVEIRNSAGRAVYRSAVQNDIASDAATFAIDQAVEIPFATMAMYVNVYETDGDPTFAQDMISSEAFTLDQLAAGDVEVGDRENRGGQVRIVSSAQVAAE